MPTGQFGKTMTDTEKRCPRCGDWKLHSQFGFDRSRPYQLSGHCLECRKGNAALGRKINGKVHPPAPKLHRRAHQAVFDAVRSGKLVKPEHCERCGIKKRRIEGHHYKGYSKQHRLSVQWLCPSCHRFAHQRPTLEAQFEEIWASRKP